MFDFLVPVSSCHLPRDFPSFLLSCLKTTGNFVFFFSWYGDPWFFTQPALLSRSLTVRCVVFRGSFYCDGSRSSGATSIHWQVPLTPPPKSIVYLSLHLIAFPWGPATRAFAVTTVTAPTSILTQQPDTLLINHSDHITLQLKPSRRFPLHWKYFSACTSTCLQLRPHPAPQPSSPCLPAADLPTASTCPLLPPACPVFALDPLTHSQRDCSLYLLSWLPGY